MRVLLALVILAALAVPSFAHDYGYRYRHGYRAGHGYRYGHGYRRTHRLARYRTHSRPYWHHPYYARYGYQRPYLYYRQLRSFGYVGYWGGPFDRGCGSRAYYYTYYSPYVSVAPVYSRLGVALTLDDPVFAKTPRADADGLPRVRAEPVGSRFLADIP